MSRRVLNVRWVWTAMLVGVLYAAVGIISGTLAGTAASERTRFLWRLSAFVISGVILAAHVLHERVRLRNTPRPAAWHASVAAAFGGFLLALAANIHDLGSATGYRPRMLVAMAAWSLLTAVPAFAVGLVMAACLRDRRDGEGNR